ncbi:MAG: hypothetical protein QM757_23165 [Paludibaculum sp.]
MRSASGITESRSCWCGGAWLEPAIHLHGPASGGRQRRQGLGDDEVGLFQGGQFESGRQDSDDLAFRAVDGQAAADHGWLAGEAALPHGVSHQGHPGDVGTVLFGDEVAAEHRLDAEHRKERRFRPGTAEAERLVAGQVTVHHTGPRGHALQLSGRPLEFPVVGPGEEVVIHPRDGDAHRDQTVRFGIGQIAEENPVHNAENSRRRADADGGDRQYGEGKAPVAAEVAESVANILGQAVQPVETARRAALLLDLVDDAELAQCGVAGLGGRHAVGDVQLDLAVEVEAEFLVEFQVGIVLPDEKAKPLNPVHGDAPSEFRPS